MCHPSIVWFRDDLRVADNPALVAAHRLGKPILPIFILDEESPGLRALGGASRWWLHQSLRSLSCSLAKMGTPLLLFRGPAVAVVHDLVAELSASGVFWNRRYGRAEREIDAELKTILHERGVQAESHNATLLYEPWSVVGRSGGHLKVFTPFWKAARTIDPSPPFPAPERLKSMDPTRTPALPHQVCIEELDLLPRQVDWTSGLRNAWSPGEAGAAKRLSDFLTHDLKGYTDSRDRPDLNSTSRLSPHLRFGEIGPRQIWSATEMVRAAGDTGASENDFAKFQAEVGWREFSYNLLFHNPELARSNYNQRFDQFPWAGDADALRLWQKGQTGYPIVDAGMRQLWQTGWMHNRVRMIVASFLIKHLMVDWRRGEEWFWDTLVDADPANNAASWQWVAGSGADAAPYYRIFNPFTQGEKFDPDGSYVRRFVPELRHLPSAVIHRPWEATQAQLGSANVRLGENYPRPLVDHGAARQRAMAAFEKLKPISN